MLHTHWTTAPHFPLAPALSNHHLLSTSMPSVIYRPHIRESLSICLSVTDLPPLVSHLPGPATQWPWWEGFSALSLSDSVPYLCHFRDKTNDERGMLKSSVSQSSWCHHYFESHLVLQVNCQQEICQIDGDNLSCQLLETWASFQFYDWWFLSFITFVICKALPGQQRLRASAERFGFCCFLLIS